MRTEFLHEPFVDAHQQHDASSLGMWTFLASEVLLFTGLLTAFASRASIHADAFRRMSHEHMHVALGTLNTAVLLTSSLTMAIAVHRARESAELPKAPLVATGTLGIVFLCVKGHEWFLAFGEHLAPWDPAATLHADERLFFVLYFVLTGVHALHLAIAVAAVLATAAWRAAPNTIEMTGLYWHLVDVVWLFLYPLFYLMGAG